MPEAFEVPLRLFFAQAVSNFQRKYLRDKPKPFS
jgi:hypothetical protein